MDDDIPARQVARWWHLATVVVLGIALLLQLGLVLAGGPNPLGTRLVRLASYFTIESNLLALVGAALLVSSPVREGAAWRIVRLDGVVAVVVTSIVYILVIRPAVHLEGWADLADIVLHYVCPAMVLAGWLAFGPRGRADRWTVLGGLIWPVAWFGWTLLHGAVTGWYPYPFIEVRRLGYGHALVNASFVTLLLLACLAGAAWADRRASAWQRTRRESRPGWGPRDAAI